ncbi:hypothetical protein PV325_004682 [Microctonus aethiopoides]|nr:hypothetical protein PV325_004682 [Microctonus aethiopoides]
MMVVAMVVLLSNYDQDYKGREEPPTRQGLYTTSDPPYFASTLPYTGSSFPYASRSIRRYPTPRMEIGQMPEH